MRFALALVLFGGCSTIQLNAAKAALQSCGTQAALTEAAQFLPVVTLLVEQQPVDWEAQLTALEGVSATGALCALSRIASSTAPAPALVPSVRARSAALKHLLNR